MEPQKRFKRYIQTRRFTGRRGLTPIKTRQKRLIPKTHRHRVEDVSVRKHTASQHHEKWEEADKSQHSAREEREGNQGSESDGKREDAQEHSQIEQSRDAQNTEESVYPGTLQTLPHLSEQTASLITPDKTEIEAEELPPWV